MIARTGTTTGTRKCSCATSSRLSTRHETFVEMNTNSRSSTVVSASVLIVPTKLMPIVASSGGPVDVARTFGSTTIAAPSAMRR